MAAIDSMKKRIVDGKNPKKSMWYEGSGRFRDCPTIEGGAGLISEDSIDGINKKEDSVDSQIKLDDLKNMFQTRKPQEMYISKEISKLRDFDSTEKYQQQVMRTIQSEADRHEEQYTLDNLKTVLARSKI